MSDELLNDGRPLVVATERDRIGQGPWARLLASAAVPDESSPPAERGRVLARSGAVHTVRVAEGALSARVAGSDGAEHDVAITAEPVPPRIWASMARFARGNRPLQAAVEGRAQSVHLEHLMTVDWDAPLVPPTRALGRSCTCADARAGACEHVAALAYVAADAIDGDPALLLRWRGCVAETDARPDEAAQPAPGRAVAAAAAEDPWLAGELPALQPRRPLPVGAVLKRLGRSGVRVGGNDLAEVLGRAYASFSAHRATP